MPKTQLTFFKDSAENVPLLDWLRELRQTRVSVYARCVASIKLLAELGHEMRRPRADYIGDGLYELRPVVGRVHYRILYFFHGKNAVVLTHGFTKEKKTPKGEIRRALEAKESFEKSPKEHSHYEEMTDDGQN